MDRYRIIKTDVQKEWLSDCPVKADKYNILLDNQTGNNVLQIKYTVLFDKHVKSIWVDIFCYDDAMDPLLTLNDVVYANVNTRAKMSFGNNQPVSVNSNAVGNIKVAIKKVVFTDETVWRNDESKIGIILPEQVLAKDVYGELFNQFYIEAKKANVPCEKEFVKADTYWQCTCGQANTANAENCCMCGANFETLAKISDKNYLSEQNNLRIEQEKAEAERIAKVRAENERLAAEKAEKERIEKEKRDAEEKLRREKAAEKRKKTVWISVLIIMLASIIGYFTVPYIQKLNKYKNAEKMLYNQQYDTAMDIYKEVETFRDSAEKISYIEYIQAEKLYSNGCFQSAYDIYSQLENYNDSQHKALLCQEQIMLSKYNDAILFYNNAYYIDALRGFAELGDYSNAVEMFENSEYMLYSEAINSLNRGDYTSLGYKFKVLAQYDYKDSKQIWENIEHVFQIISGCYKSTTYYNGRYHYISTDAKSGIIDFPASGHRFTLNPSTGGKYGKYNFGGYNVVLYDGYLIEEYPNGVNVKYEKEQ